MFTTLHKKITKMRSSSSKKKEANAKRAVLEELFNDLYTARTKIYKLNFMRGIAFGVGSALGGTLVIAVVVWVLSLFVNFPLIGSYFENAQNSIEGTSQEVQRSAE